MPTNRQERAQAQSQTQPTQAQTARPALPEAPEDEPMVVTTQPEPAATQPEPAAAEPATIEPAPAPSAATQPSAAVPAVTEPAPAGSLPAYDAPASALAPASTLALAADQPAPERAVPGNGAGLLTASGLVFAGSATLFLGSGLMAGAGYEAGDWGAALGVGVAGTVAGSALLAIGLRRKRSYRAWQAEQVDGEQIPAHGTGMITSGSMLLIFGATAGPVGTAFTAFRCYEVFEACDPSPVGPIVLGAAVGSLVVGSGLMIAGVRRHEKLKRWRRETAPLVQLQPNFGPLIGGAQVGVVGRF